MSSILIRFSHANGRSISNSNKEVIVENRRTMKITKLIPAIVISAGLTFGVVAQAIEETPVEMKDLPAAAQNTIKEKAGNDQILRIQKETRKGKECYDAIVNKNGKEAAIRVDANGKFLGTHQEKTEQKTKSESEKY